MFQGVFIFHVGERIPWSALFEKVERLKEKLNIDYVLLSDTTLEQIFINLGRKGRREAKKAKKRKIQAAKEPKVKVPKRIKRRLSSAPTTVSSVMSPTDTTV